MSSVQRFKVFGLDDSKIRDPMRSSRIEPTGIYITLAQHCAKYGPKRVSHVLVKLTYVFGLATFCACNPILTV